VVHYQDKATKAHMDKDPEDVRYNFIRWLSNDIGTAIGPSRAHPETGQILDADVVLTDGWIRHFWHQANEFLPQTAMEGLTPETLRWLEQHPDWDPRVRLASPGQRDRLLAESQKRALLGPAVYEAAFGDASVLANEGVFALARELSDASLLCMASEAKSQSMELAGLNFEIFGLLDDEQADEKGEKKDEIDGIPEWFLGPVLAELVSHEVGHTLGLRHNFKASGIYTLAQMNSPEFKGQKALAGSVMDYLPINVVLDEQGELQGDVSMVGIGPYDMWAIQYGYTLDDPATVLARVSEAELVYLTDEDTMGPDPLARRYDLCADPLEFARSRMKLVDLARAQILDKFVKSGEPWARARWGYEITLGTQMSVLSMMSGWLGGSFVNRDHKGDPGERAPIAAVPAEAQRAALDFVLKGAFFDQAFGLTPELLARMTVEKWYDEGGQYTVMEDPTYPIHDRVAGIQASVLTRLMNPTVLRRVYDNELAVTAEEDVLSLPELLDAVSNAVWEEVGFGGSGARAREASWSRPKAFTVRRPAITSLRRNLQREHLERLLDLALQKGSSSSTRSIALLARMTLENLGQAIEANLSEELDPYTRAHLADARTRIQKALDASYTYNASAGGSLPPIIIQIGQDEGAAPK
jgi:hypothetical protein